MGERIQWRGGRVLVVGSVASSATSCLVGPDYQPPPAKVPEQWDGAGDRVIEPVQGAPAAPLDWWKTFQDPVLERLVAEALEQNLELRAAALRIVQARARRVVALELLFPVITGGGSVTHVNLSENVKPDVEAELPTVTINVPQGPGILNLPPLIEVDGEVDVDVKSTLDIYDVGIAAEWDLDVWGGKRRRMEAADAMVDAAYATYDDILVSLVSEVAAAYVQVRAFEERIAINQRGVDTAKRFQEIAEKRVADGQSLETDKYLAITLTALMQTKIPALQLGLAQSRFALAQLLGRLPQDLPPELSQPAAIPIAPKQATAGVPADLLRRRPDVRAAERRTHAQCAHLGTTKASVYPSLSLVGAIGYASSHSGDLFDSESVRGAYGGSVGVTGILLYPFLVEFIRIEDAKLEEAMLGYQHAVLVACREVEDAMAQFEEAWQQVEILGPAVEAARHADTMSVSAYQDGKVIISVPLVALTIESGFEDALAANRAAATLSLIAMHRALGGGWEIREGKDLVPQEIRARMEERSDWSTFGGGYDLRTARSESPQGQ